MAKRQGKQKNAVADYGSMTLVELERVVTLRQRKFVAYLADGLSGTEAAVKAGYSARTAASQASELLRNPKVSAYRKEFMKTVLERLCLTPESIAVRLYEVYERCMSKTPVLEYDRDAKEHVPSGEWQFDSRGAVRVLELLGRNAGMFAERVQLAGSGGVLEDYMASKRRERGVSGE